MSEETASQSDVGSCNPMDEQIDQKTEDRPRFRYVKKDDPVGTIGVSPTGMICQVVRRKNETGEPFNSLV